MSLKIMILGANGFIGSALTSAILKSRDWDVYGIDLADNKLGDAPQNQRFHFVEGDITINKEWVEYHVKKCDVVVPLVAIANPAQYVTHPLRVFELDFEANIDIVRHCVKYNKRLIFPSTSEIYGMSPDAVLDEESSPLTYGPINKQRWIYAASKQLLDRVIYAYGVRDNLDYTLFRPFNFIGPNLDNVEEPKEGSSRVFTQFLSNVLYRRPIKLVDGGSQKRSFTYIDDAIEALLTHSREQGRLRQPPHLQHRQSAQLHLDPGAGAAHHPHCPGVPGAARCGQDHRDRRHLRRGVLRQVLPGHPGARAEHRGGGARPGLEADHRHGYRDPPHHCVLRQPGRLRHPRGSDGRDLAAALPSAIYE